MIKSFLQSKDWARFQEAFGRKIFWVDEKLVIKFDLPLGKSWLYAPRVELKTKNPSASLRKDKKLKTSEDGLFIKELNKFANKENAIFAKIEPGLVSSIKNQVSGINPESKILNTSFKILASNCLQPQDELILDISPSEGKLLAQMHQKTRYNIRLAQKKGLKIVESTDPKDIDVFYQLAVKTSARDGFKYHSKGYYSKMLEVLGKSKDVNVELLIIEASIENLVSGINTKYKLPNTNFRIPVASAILLYYDDTCYYLHGASDWNQRQLMAPYLMQWEGICRAKKKGYKYYNFGGVAPTQLTNQPINQLTKTHPWTGITRFKLGFAPEGKFLHYPDCYDIVYQSGWYWIYKIIKKLK